MFKCAPIGNVIQMGFGFLLVFASFNGQGFIEELVIRSYHEMEVNATATGNYTGHVININAGYYSLCIIYAVFTFANFIAAPIVNLIGSRMAMFIGALCYSTLVATFLILREWLLYLTSAILGFGASIIWTGQGVYLTDNSDDSTIGRHSGIMWALLQSGMVIAGIFLYFQFGTSDQSDITVAESRIAYTVFLIVIISGAAILALLSPPPKKTKEKADLETENDVNDITISIEHQESVIADSVTSGLAKSHVTKFQQWIIDLKNTFKLGLTYHMLMLSVVFFYTGIETAYWSGLYSTCLGSTTQFGASKNALIAYNTILTGIGEIVGGGAFGILGKRTNKYGRNPIVLFASIIHIIAYFLSFLNIPANAPLEQTSDIAYIQPSIAVALTTSFLLGLADSCWNTQIYSLLGSKYKDDESSSAFALFKFYQSAGATVAFFYASVLVLTYQLGILVVFNFFAAILFFPVEWKTPLQPNNQI